MPQIFEQSKENIGFFTPYYRSARGNAITAKRIQHGLLNRGISVELFAYDEALWSDETHRRMSSTSVYHILHATRFVAWQKQHRFPLDRPYIVTLGGTDINLDLEKGSLSKEMHHFLTRASFITVFTDDGYRKVIDLDPAFTNKTKIIPQSVWFSKQPTEKIKVLPVLDDLQKPLILLPAGLRPVKDVLYLLDTIPKLQKKLQQDVQFVVIGERIDDATYQHVRAADQTYDWFHYVGNVPFHQMPAVYKKADLVVNTSIAEGQSLALMEAMHLGVPVIARRNGANESIVADGQTGFLFNNPAEFIEKAMLLLENKTLAATIAQRGQQYILQHYSLEHEIENFLELYAQICCPVN